MIHTLLYLFNLIKGLITETIYVLLGCIPNTPYKNVSHRDSLIGGIRVSKFIFFVTFIHPIRGSLYEKFLKGISNAPPHSTRVIVAINS